ncbi:hypothetical protein ACIBSV_45795 [Embleya sp. NPDC050154]|uniref:hypothetical protein n=1 Tax=Embleya sp. NPDC050154 TaxID=3363988 RepID=UPI0037B7928C
MIHCPRCRQVDQVVKVRALYESGVTVTKSRGTASIRLDGPNGFASASGSVRGSGRAQTSLSRSLAPPRRPWAARGWRQALVAAFVVMSVSALVINATLGSAASWAGLGFAAWFLVAYRRRYRVAYPAWRGRRLTWARLFCCRRCDGVFLPTDDTPAHLPHLRGRFVERHAMSALLDECVEPL